MNIVPNTEKLFQFLILAISKTYIVNENCSAGNVNSWQQIFYSFNISLYFNSLLNLVTSVLLNSRNCQKKSQSICITATATHKLKS